MDEDKLGSLRERAERLKRELDGLAAEAGDFPALAKNAARMRASLAMIAINLGMEPDDPEAV